MKYGITDRRKKINALVEAAHESPGEWFSIPSFGSGTNGVTQGMIRHSVASRVAQFSAKEDRTWVSFRAESK
jgi:hypothetical protein